MADSVYFHLFFFCKLQPQENNFLLSFFIQLNLCPCKETKKKGKEKSHLIFIQYINRERNMVRLYIFSWSLDCYCIYLFFGGRGC